MEIQEIISFCFNIFFSREREKMIWNLIAAIETVLWFSLLCHYFLNNPFLVIRQRETLNKTSDFPGNFSDNASWEKTPYNQSDGTHIGV